MMKKSARPLTIMMFLLLLNTPIPVKGQAKDRVVVEFRNAPVLLREGTKSLQKILAEIKSPEKGSLVITISGKQVFSGDFSRNNNKFLLNVPSVSKPEKINISVTLDKKVTVKYPFLLIPPKKWEVLLVQHSHTDIGYTRPQSEILAEQMRYIDYALDYCDQTDNLPEASKFRWTCESAWVTREFLRTRPEYQIARFKKRIAEGRIEVTGMFANMAEITDENLMYDFLQPLKELTSSGITVKAAMQNDVNGIAWCMPDYFKNTGIKYLIMGLNETRSVLPFNKPTAFWWEAPSGARLLAFRADHYMTGNFFGIESKSVKEFNLLSHLAEIDLKGYPFDKIGIQFSGYFTDNSPPSTAACKLVEEWNSKYDSPKLRLALASDFPEYVEKTYSESLPVYRKAWLDWWTDGFGSTSRETAEIRKTQNQLQADEGLFAMVSLMNGKLSPMTEDKIAHIAENAIFFDEHTCGADESIDRPFSENSTRQWLQKGAYAWEALKQVTLLNEEASARLQEFMPKAGFPVIYVVNSLGWQRSGNVRLFIDGQILPLNRKARIIDLSTGNDVPYQQLNRRSEGSYWVLEVSDVPALGFKALKVELGDLAETPGKENLEAKETLENSFYKISVDKNTGAISSLFDKELGTELIDQSNPYQIGQLVHETVPNRDSLSLKHTSVVNVNVEPGKNGLVWESIMIKADMDGFTTGQPGSPKGFDIEIRLYKNVKKVEFLFSASKEIITSPEALYVTFPFTLPDSRIVFETIGGTLSQGQQLPGSSTDWNTVQNFVAIRSKTGQIIVVSNEAPLWMFSDFNLGKYDRIPKAGKTWLYSYVMNNYWFTNFRAFQEGGFTWSYQLTSVRDTSNSYATRYSWNERNPFPTRTFPAGEDKLKDFSVASLKISGSQNALLVNTRPVFKKERTILLHFRELDGKPAEVKISAAVPGITITSLTEVNSLGVPVVADLSSVRLKPYEVKFIEVRF
jgi:alpha-mannosidase